MVRHYLTQVGATAGEFSPRVYGQSTLAQYKQAFETLRNTIPLPQGPLTKRPGSLFIASFKDETREPMLVDFIFSTEQAYMLEFGQNYIRFYRNRGVLLSGASITNGTFNTDISGWTDVSSGTGSTAWNTDHMDLISGVAGNEAITRQAIDYVGIEQYTLTLDVGTNSLTVRVGTTAGGSEVLADTIVAVGAAQTVTFTPTTAGTVYLQIANNNASSTATLDNISLDTPIYTINSPYTADQAREIDYTQSADVLFLTHGSYPPATLSRFGSAQWLFRNLDIEDGPYDVANTVTTQTLTPSATTGAITITAVGHAPFVAGDVGRWVRIKHTAPDTWGAAKITSFVSTTVVNAQVSPSFPFLATSASFEWRLGQWADSQGWPQKCALHEQRLTCARSIKYLDRIWMTESQGYSSTKALMSPTNTTGQVLSSNAINAPIASGQPNAIEWMSSGPTLAIGTQGAEFILEAADRSKAIAPENHRIILTTTAGCREFVRPVRVDGQILFAQRTGFKVREFRFSFETDAYVAKDITILADHITRPGIKGSAYSKEPFSTVWWLLTDGSLATLTYVADQEVGGWSRHTIAGSFQGSDHAIVERIAAIPSGDDGYSEIWMCVKRTINGIDHRYLEVLEKPFFQDIQQEAYYLDSFLVYDGPLTDVMTGLDHLEGEEVLTLSEGAAEAAKTVTGGQITLESETTYAVIGLRYLSEIKTLTYEATTAFGSAIGHTKRITGTSILVYETQGIKVGRESGSLTIMPDRAPTNPMDTAPPLQSGHVEFQFIHGWAPEAHIVIEHDLPTPFTISAIALTAVTNEK